MDTLKLVLILIGMLVAAGLLNTLLGEMYLV